MLLERKWRRPRSYTGSITPPRGEAFLRLRTFPGERAQADGARFGEASIGRARRRLSAFVLTLSLTHALWLEFLYLLVAN